MFWVCWTPSELARNYEAVLEIRIYASANRPERSLHFEGRHFGRSCFVAVTFNELRVGDLGLELQIDQVRSPRSDKGLFSSGLL